MLCMQAVQALIQRYELFKARAQANSDIGSSDHGARCNMGMGTQVVSHAQKGGRGGAQCVGRGGRSMPDAHGQRRIASRERSEPAAAATKQQCQRTHPEAHTAMHGAGAPGGSEALLSKGEQLKQQNNTGPANQPAATPATPVPMLPWPGMAGTAHPLAGMMPAVWFPTAEHEGAHSQAAWLGQCQPVWPQQLHSHPQPQLPWYQPQLQPLPMWGLTGTGVMWSQAGLNVAAQAWQPARPGTSNRQPTGTNSHTPHSHAPARRPAPAAAHSTSKAVPSIAACAVTEVTTPEPCAAGDPVPAVLSAAVKRLTGCGALTRNETEGGCGAVAERADEPRTAQEVARLFKEAQTGSAEVRT